MKPSLSLSGCPQAAVLATVTTIPSAGLCRGPSSSSHTTTTSTPRPSGKPPAATDRPGCAVTFSAKPRVLRHRRHKQLLMLLCHPSRRAAPVFCPPAPTWTGATRQEHAAGFALWPSSSSSSRVQVC